MKDNSEVICEFVDKYGDNRVIHRPKGRVLAVKRTKRTPALALNQEIARMIGEKIREHRVRQHHTLESLCIAAGIVSSYPKNRMWEIEKGVRKEGLRMGTLYAIAAALHIEPSELLPDLRRVLESAGVKLQAPSAVLMVAEGARDVDEAAE